MQLGLCSLRMAKMMNKLAKKFISVFPIYALLMPALSLSEARAEEGEGEANFEYRTVVTKEGLSFRVPEDMPIEKRGGIQAPIPFDEYVYGKFDRMDKKVRTLETRIEELEKTVASMNEKKPVVLKTQGT